MTTTRNIDFDSLFDTAWRFNRQYKFLYLFGLISAVGSTSVGRTSISRFLYQYESGFTTLWGIPVVPDVPPFQRLPYLDSLTPIPYLSLLIIVALWLVHFIADAGLTFAVVELSRHKTPNLPEIIRTTFGQGIRLLLLNLLLFGGFYLIILLVIQEVITGRSMFFVKIISASPTGCALLPLMLISWGVYPFAKRSLIYYDHSILASLRHSFRLIGRNLDRLVPVFIFIFFVVLALPPSLEGLGILIETILEFSGGLSEILQGLISTMLAIGSIFISTHLSVIVTLLFLDCDQFLASEPT